MMIFTDGFFFYRNHKDISVMDTNQIRKIRRARSRDCSPTILAELLRKSQIFNDNKKDERIIKDLPAAEISSTAKKVAAKANDPEITAEELEKMAADVGDGRLLKMDKDYTQEVETLIATCEKQLASGVDLVTVLDNTSRLEKLTRLGMDMKSNKNILMFIAKTCIQRKEWSILADQVTVLSKKRSIIKFAVSKMIGACCEQIDNIENEKERDQFVESLRNVTAGKIYVEIERARLSRRVAMKLEREGKINEAWDIMMELQVETFGSMPMDEKVNYLLEQMRLSIVRGEWIRALVISRKINRRYFDKNPTEIVQSLKLIFYNYMVQISLHDEEYLEACRHYLAIFDTAIVQADVVEYEHALKCATLYVLLSQHNNEQWDLLHRISEYKKFKDIPVFVELVKLFTKEEIIDYNNTILPRFKDVLVNGTPECVSTNVFQKINGEEKRWNEFKTRVGEHNLRMVSKYYSKITFDRLAVLMDCSVEEMETFLCNLIVNGIIPHAKIDRPRRIINLEEPKNHLSVLDAWASDVSKLTGLLNNISHLILKEEMIHKL
uniref:PCI domain-containing protein n=2 Tax=Strongyloides stercoralis TaxID=6248 RepID=A0AAF5D9S9_STRER